LLVAFELEVRVEQFVDLGQQVVVLLGLVGSPRVVLLVLRALE
jgi:hypothetical protein